MEYIENRQALEGYLEKWKIAEIFRLKNLDFRLVSFEKGELLTTADYPLNNFLFIVKGEVKIYGIPEDGGMYSVYGEGPGAFLGDMEFARKKDALYMTEAVTKVLCVALPIEQNRKALSEDPVFLRFIIDTLYRKFDNIAKTEFPVRNLEEKLLLHLRDSRKGHDIDSVEQTVSRLRCSRRQLQRVIKKLCLEGKLTKTGKGHYVLCVEK